MKTHTNANKCHKYHGQDAIRIECIKKFKRDVYAEAIDKRNKQGQGIAGPIYSVILLIKKKHGFSNVNILEC